MARGKPGRLHRTDAVCFRGDAAQVALKAYESLMSALYYLCGCITVTFYACYEFYWKERVL